MTASANPPHEDLDRDSDGVSGVLVRPTGSSRGAVLIVGGSEGGCHPADAAALAEHGFAALALSYFGAPGLPGGLVEIPVEYLRHGVEVLRDRSGHDTVGIVGGSRGGEAGLLVASRDDRVRAVVSVSGSGVITPGIDFALGSLDRILAASSTAWTEHGRPVTGVRHHLSDEVLARIAEGGVVRLADTFPDLPTGDELDAVSIPVERINGAVLLLSGERDGLWPSATFSAVAARRLERHGHRFPWHQRVFEATGHAIAGPPRPAPAPSIVPGPGVQFDLGGDPDRTWRSNQDAWQLTVEFLVEHL